MVSRRDFLTRLSAALVSWPVRCAPPATGPVFVDAEERMVGPAADDRWTPHYRAKSPLEDVIRKVEPGLDEFPTEKYKAEIEPVLGEWAQALRESPAKLQAIGKRLSPEFSGASLRASAEERLRSHAGLEVLRTHFGSHATSGRERFLEDLGSFLGEFSSIMTAEFKVTGISVNSTAPLSMRTRIRYDLVGSAPHFFRAERIGHWELEWERYGSWELRVRKWEALEDSLAHAAEPVYVEITEQVIANNPSYAAQLLRGIDYWRTVLDAASGIDVYGNNGIAVGDIDNDGFDDLYICQPAGLPNRLYRNRGDGTLEDVTEVAGVGVLDSTACALFADVDNDSYQDLLVVRSNGPLLFLNQRNGKFRLKSGAFRFAQPPQGTFTGAALADYDRDGRLDVYFCLYSYYQGLDQYRFPVPYYDAQNGPPNFLFHNNGDGTFDDVTPATGMDQNNNRFTFACGWCDYNNDGWPDLYVANDFGRNNLYRNKGNGTFLDVAEEADIEDIGAGMSVCWFDYDNDSQQDLYVSNMWSSAGKRLTTQQAFMKDLPERIRELYRKHANGNSLFRNERDRHFYDQSARAEVEMGRWAWSSDAWDFDHDGYPDLYVANGMISAPNTHDLSSFFWRQVVSHSPLEAGTSRDYEEGWNAINELIRSDGTWSGYERNVFYVNNRDGTFSDVSGVVGLDFSDDSRAFALTDFDHDGRLEIFLKNRTAPQLRILRNGMRTLADSIAFRLRGKKSNRDAIGAEVTLEAGAARQTKFLQAGSGFLSQHTKELFFGLGNARDPLRASVRWPSGLVQQFDHLPSNHRIEIEEGSQQFRAIPFLTVKEPAIAPSPPQVVPPLPAVAETWLLDPLPAPSFSLADLEGRSHSLESLRGRPVLLNFWAMERAACQQALKIFQERRSRWAGRGLRVVAVNVNDPSDVSAVRRFIRERGYSFLVLLGDADTVAVYNVLYRYLFDRRRDLGISTSFLLDDRGLIVKVYQGPVDPEHLEEDLTSIPRIPKERIAKALPFPGEFYGGEFRRNFFTYGVAYFQRGYLDQAADSFERALRSNPDYAEAHYNLGTLYLRKKMSDEARQHLQRAIELRPDYPDALNNLGLLAADSGQSNEAIRYFQEAIRLKPNYTIALENLGNLYRRRGRLAEARQLLEQALRSDPDDPEVNYSLGMLFAQQENAEGASEYFQKAIKLRPDYPEALNNLGVLYLRTRRPTEAAAAFQDCIRVDPSFDQPYLNLAKLYVAMGAREKAEAVLQQLLEQNPTHELARKALDQLRRQSEPDQ